MIHAIFTADGIPRWIGDHPVEGSEPVEPQWEWGDDLVMFMAAHRRTEAGEWVARDPVLRVEPTLDQVASQRAAALADARAAAEIDRFEFASRVAQLGYVSFVEAAAWAAGNAIPAKLQAIIDTLPEAERGPAILDVLARPILRRDAGLMPALAAAFGASDADMDRIFGIEGID